MEKSEKIVPGFTMIGLRYDNSSGVECIPDEQLFDDLRILSPDHTVSLYDMRKLKEIKDELLYRDGDFKLVEVLPYRDHVVDYTGVVFDLAWVLAEKDLPLSADGETVLMQMWDARAIAQTGVLFGIIPWDVQKIPGLQYNEEQSEIKEHNYEDEIQPYIFAQPAGPVVHEPDLQMVVKNGHDDEHISQNGHGHKKPPAKRLRVDHKTAENRLG